MQENEFEKRVQKKMEELSFVPSDSVWHKVDEELRPKREKRYLLWMLPLAIVLIGIGWWKWAIYNNNNLKPSVAANESSKQSTKPNVISVKPNVSGNPDVSANKSTDANKSNNASKLHAINKSDSANPNKIISKPGFATTPNGDHKQEVIVNKSDLAAQSNAINHGKKDIRKQQAASNKNLLSPSINNLKQEDKSPTLSSLNVDNKKVRSTEAAKITDEIINNDSNKSSPLTKPDITAKEQNKKLTVDTASDKNYKMATLEKVKEDSSETKPVKIVMKQKKWEKVILIQAGWSNYGGSLFNNTFGIMDINSNAMLSPGSSIPGLNFPNKITKGAAFAIGAGIKRSLNKRMKIGIAIQYSFFSTNMRIGRAVLDSVGFSSSSRAQYFNTMENNYTNKFHVAELPVSLEYKLLRKLPLQLSGGASYGYLLRTNALTYNNITNMYYYNRSNYLSNYLNIFSSLQYQFLQKGKVRVQSGPMILYNTIVPEKASRIGVPHLYSYGLKTDIIF